MDESLSTILCIASYEKGGAFLAELKAQGCNVVLLTAEKHRGAAWPAVDAIHTFSDVPGVHEVVQLALRVARHVRIDRVVPLDEFDLEAAAMIREEMRLPGMGYTTARHFRDKLAMRTRARAAGIAVPDFIGVHNHDDVHAFLKETRGPWLLKPRMSASAIGIRRIEQANDLWHSLEELGDEATNFVLERFVPGDVYHVDSIAWERRVLSQSVQVYGMPPMRLMHGGGVFTTRTLDRGAVLTTALRALDATVVPVLGMVSGVTHSEYIVAEEDRQIYFLESAARVGGAFIAELVEASTGLNPWVEWARIEAALAKGTGYAMKPEREMYAGSVICLSRQEWPDLSAFNDPEIVLRIDKRHHAGLLVQAATPQRVEALVQSYGERFEQDFLATMPAPDRPTA